MERNYSSLKGITLAPSMSSTQRCSQILSRGYLLTLAVCLSVTLSVSIFPSHRNERNLFYMALCFCLTLTGPLLRPHFLFMLLFKGAAVCDFENKKKSTCLLCCWSLLHEIITCSTAVHSQMLQTTLAS